MVDLGQRLLSLMNLDKIREHLRRTPWREFGSVTIVVPEVKLKAHPHFSPAKAGDASAAEALVDDILGDTELATLQTALAGVNADLLAVHAAESVGMNAIPRALAIKLSRRLGSNVASGVIQINRVLHTGADGVHRLAYPPVFDGHVDASDFIVVDDFVGQGGTLANLKGFVESRGGRVVRGIALAGRDYSAQLQPTEATIERLREKHGEELEEWWSATFGYGFDCLTESEARYLTRLDDVNSIRARLTAARGAGNR